jgi:hypothetical protein
MGLNNTQQPGGVCGIAGKLGGRRMLIADIGSSGVAKGTTKSGWYESGPSLGNIDGKQSIGAHFSSVRNQVRQQWLITGVTKDSTGAALGGCTVTLFKTVDNLPCCTTVSDAAGNYSFSIDGNSEARFAVSYKAGSPDVTGATVNTLVPVLT